MTKFNAPKSPSKIIQISKFISNFFNPITSLFIYFIYYSSIHYTWRQSSDIFLPILLITVIPISLWIFWNVKKKRYTNMDVSDRQQRKGFYFFISGAVLSYLLYNYLVKNSVDLVMLFLFILLSVMQISNYFIKSSMHTSFNIFVAALFYAVKPSIGILWLGIAVIVGITRVILKRHTPNEVFTGALLGLLISFVYLYAHIQFQ